MGELDPGVRVNMHLRVHSVKIIRQRQRYDGDSQTHSKTVEKLVELKHTDVPFRRSRQHNEGEFLFRSHDGSVDVAGNLYNTLNL